jgi:hypothetical protein
MQEYANLAKFRGDICKYVDAACTVNDLLRFQNKLLEFFALSCLAYTTEKARRLCQEEMAYPKSWNLVLHKFLDKFGKLRSF